MSIRLDTGYTKMTYVAHVDCDLCIARMSLTKVKPVKQPSEGIRDGMMIYLDPSLWIVPMSFKPVTPITKEEAEATAIANGWKKDTVYGKTILICPVCVQKGKK